MHLKSDIVIIGGGVIGSSIAYNLLHDGYTGDITVFEKDKVQEFSSTGRSAGGIRQLFTTPINVKIGRYSVKKYRNFSGDMEVDGEKAEINFEQNGYLFLSKDENIENLKQQMEMQNSLGVPSQFLSGHELSEIIPELNTADLQGGLYCAEDGYLDPYSVMQGYARKAKQLGADYRYEEVSGILKEKGNVKGVELADGEIHEAPIVLNCAGPWAAEMSEKLGLPLPIVPLRRQIIQFNTEEPLRKKLPLTIDPTGIYFRHEGNTVITGFGEDVEPGIRFDWSRDFFIEQLWPTLAGRISNFEKAKIVRGWAGIYSYNTIDQNAIIGAHPELSGYYIAAGFSGHGMQQAPAVGKGLSELIRLGRYETLDLSPLRLERFKENDLVLEEAIV